MLKSVVGFLLFCCLIILFYPETPDNEATLNNNKGDINFNTIHENDIKPVSQESPKGLIHSYSSELVGQHNESRSDIEESNLVSKEASLLEKFYSGELEVEAIVEDSDLHRFLLSKWDGESAAIEDHVYDISVDVLNEGRTVFFKIKNKFTMIESVEDFRASELPAAIDELEKHEYGPYSPEMEHWIMEQVESLKYSHDKLFVHSIKCRLKKCVLFAEAATENLIMKLDDRLRKMKDGILVQRNQSNTEKAFAIFTIFFDFA